MIVQTIAAVLQIGAAADWVSALAMPCDLALVLLSAGQQRQGGDEAAARPEPTPRKPTWEPAPGGGVQMRATSMEQLAAMLQQVPSLV